MKRTIQEYVLKNQEVFIGLEDSKRTWKLCVRNNKMTVHETSMPAQYEVLRNYLQNRFPECRINLMYEAGFSGFTLFRKITADGWNCIVTPPHTITEEKCQRQKNDRIDCRRISKNLENGDYRKCYVSDKEHLENRQIVRLHEQTQKDITRVCNRIRRTLEYHGLDEQFKPGAWTSKDYRNLHQMLENMNLSPSLFISFDIFLKQLEFLRDQKKRCVEELRNLARSERYKKDVKLVSSAPGIGLLTAIRLVLEWGDIRSRFSEKSKFANFLGLVPGEYSSGEKERKGHITKQGCRWVRKWLVECSWVAIRHDPVLLDKFNRVVRSNGSKKKAIVAVARKLALRIRAVLLTEQEYAVGLIK
jgi:transposase